MLRAATSLGIDATDEKTGKTAMAADAYGHDSSNAQILPRARRHRRQQAQQRGDEAAECCGRFTARDFGRPRSPRTMEGYRPKRHPVGDTASEEQALCGADAGKPEGNNP